MKRVAVLGGGPAGAFAAERLAAGGLSTILVDENLAWEKPCGGGLTWKAWSQYPFLFHNAYPKKLVQRTYLRAGGRESASLDLTQPLLIYSRYDLNQLLLERAQDAGATLEKSRVLQLERRGSGWIVRTRSGRIDADFCVVATGARNGLRETGTQWNAGDTMSSLGYFIPHQQDHVDLEFIPGLEGYIWIFPRQGHVSAGIAGKGKPASELRSILQSYLAAKGIAVGDAPFFGHVIPSLEVEAWKRNRVAGDGWIAVGDAAGLVDPVTGEGLYYAMRSAELASDSILRLGLDAPSEYLNAVGREMFEDLAVGARLAKKLFLGKFLLSEVTTRMIQCMRRSPTILQVMQDLFAGTQGYVDLKPRLLASRGKVLRELAFGARTD
ncbi:MAG: NAD(P)/FAD-dependent oxidoreductase [Bryobacteraceae bacterium]|nr:NAD(P)/FAD-dependent oxidoreductase [Bryobacteraceae bacterium]